MAEALQEGLGEDYTLTVSGYGYIGSLTGPDDFNAANAGVEFWGQYYYIDGAYDTSSPLTVPVTDGAVYGIFANEKNTTGENYGYKYNVWIHERSVTAEAETAFDVTVYQMQGNTAVPQAGVKVYADGNVMGVSDENGKVICRFEPCGRLCAHDRRRAAHLQPVPRPCDGEALQGDGHGPPDGRERHRRDRPHAGGLFLQHGRRGAAAGASARTMSSRSANMATSAA